MISPTIQKMDSQWFGLDLLYKRSGFSSNHLKTGHNCVQYSNGLSKNWTICQVDMFLPFEYSGGSNTVQVRYSDGSKLFGSSPSHSKTELQNGCSSLDHFIYKEIVLFLYKTT